MSRISSVAGWILLLAMMVASPLGCTAEPGDGGGESSSSAPSGDTGGSDDPAENTSDSGTVGDAPGSGDGAMASIREFIASQDVDKSKQNWKTSLAKPPIATFDPDKTYYWNLKTSVGDIKIRLMADIAPMHVTSTIYLTELGFYDDISFHRIMAGFMAQGGDPLGNGRGGPGYKYGGEFDSTVRHDRPGLLSMANAGRNTDGSQFFLTFVPTPHLNDKHTIFGEVVSGMDSVKALEKVGKENRAPNGMLPASVRPVIEKASISVE